MPRSTPDWLEAPANAAPEGFVHAPDTGARYWSQQPQNTLPPPDFWSPYARNRPLPTPGVENRKAWIVGSGIAGLAAAFYLIRDGHVPPANITILDAAQIEGGSLDGAGDVECGYLIRGGREMNWNYDNLWDLFQDVPALELPQGYSVLDEYRWVNDRDPNYSKARLLHQRGVVQDFRTFGLSRKDQWEIVRLLLKRKDEVGDTTIQDYFNEGFFETNFWALFRTMFAFQPWHSLLEMKLYLHRFLDSVDGFADMSVVVFPKYDQFDSFVRPLTKMLREQGIRFQFDTRAYDLDFAVAGEKRTVTGIRAMVSGAATVLPVAAQDLVFVLPGSMTEGTAYGDMDQAPVLARGAHEPGADSDWTLWRNLAAQSPVFGKPDKFCGDVARSMWESATLTCRPSPLVDRLKKLAVNDPYSGRTVTGGILTFTDSKWLLSVTCNRQPHFPNQPEDVLVLWAYALRMDVAGDKVPKAMPDCTGREILEELCHHLGIAEDQVAAVAAATKVRLALMPYITAEFMPRAAGDRPAVVPQGCTNLALVGQFVETANDIVFTMESSIRTARIGVYTLLNVLKQVPDISPTQYDIRNLLRGARALNNGAPFPGERLLHRLLGKSYFAHILPPLPEKDGDALHRVEEELAGLFGRGSQWVNEAADTVRSWMAGVKER